jgi:bacterioferritin-associated ferredoxin
MFACVCHAVPDEDVAHAVDCGADTIEAVTKQTRAGSSCMMCHDHIEDVIERSRHCRFTSAEVARI